MCNICNKIGIRHEDLNVQESSPAAPIYKDAVSSSGTLNFNEGDNIIIPSENGVTYRGLGGNDAYIISTNTTEANSKIEIIDSAGDNVIQLINGLIISKSLLNLAIFLISRLSEIIKCLPSFKIRSPAKGFVELSSSKDLIFSK